MRLFHDPIATGSRAVTLFAAHAEIPIEYVHVGLAQGDQHAAAFAALNPNRQVPVLDDDGFILTETGAILRYLADLCGSSAYPVERRARAIVDARLDWFNTGFARDAAHGLAYPSARPELRLSIPDAAAQMLLRGRQNTERWLAVLDGHWLKEGGYVAGPVMSIADFLGSIYVGLLEVVEFDMRPYPAIRQWMATMRRLPHWQECNAAFEGMLSALTQLRANSA